MVQKKKRKIKLYITLAFTILIVTAVSVTLYKIPETVRKYIVVNGSELLGRELYIGKIEIDYLQSAVTVHELLIKANKGREFLFRFEKLRVDIELWALIWKKIKIEGLELSSPQISIQRIHEDNFNFSDILQRLVLQLNKSTIADVDNIDEEINTKDKNDLLKKKKSNKNPKADNADKIVKNTPVKKKKSFQIEDVRLKDFSILFLDKALGREIKLTIRDFALQLDKIQTDNISSQKLHYSNYLITGKFLDADLNLAGKIALGNNKILVQSLLKVDKLNLSQGAPYWKYFANFTLNKGKMNAKLNHTLSYKYISPKLELLKNNISGVLNFTSLVISNHTVTDKNLTIHKTNFKIRNADLLMQKVRIDYVNVYNTNFHVILNEQGVLNFTKFFSFKKRKIKAVSKKPKKNKKFIITFSVINLFNTDILFQDKKVQSNKLFKLHFAKWKIFNFHSNPSFYSKFNIEGKISLLDENNVKEKQEEKEITTTIIANGKSRLYPLHINSDVKIENMPLIFLQDYLRDNYYPVSGEFTGNYNINFSPVQLKIKGNSLVHNPVIYKGTHEIIRFYTITAEIKNLLYNTQKGMKVNVLINTDKYSSIFLKGYSNKELSDINIRLKFKNQEISRFNYFIKTNSAYRMISGTVDLDAKLKLLNKNGDIDTKISLLAPKTEMVNAQHPLRLPVDLDLAFQMLMDANDRISLDVDIPLLSGKASFENLQPIITDFILKYLSNRILEPFKKIAKIFYDGNEVSKIEFFPVQYEYGSDELSKPAKKILNNLGDFLQNHKKISIYMLSRADYKHEYGMHKEKQEKIKKVLVKKKVAKIGLDTTENKDELKNELKNKLKDDPINPKDQNKISADNNPNTKNKLNMKKNKNEFVIVEEWVDEKYLEDVDVANPIPDIPYIKNIIEKRNYQVTDYILSKYAIKKDRITKFEKEPGNTEEMHSARTEFGLR